MKYILGADGGGSKIEYALSDCEGNNVKIYRFEGGTNPNFSPVEEINKNFESQINQICTENGITESDIALAYICVAGHGQLLAKGCPKLNVEKLIIQSDVYANWAGALGCEPGISVNAGTGSCALGVNEDGYTQSSGGWGSILGDEGGGYDIAVKGLKAMVHFVELKGAETLIAKLVFEHPLLNHYPIAQKLAKKYPERPNNDEALEIHKKTLDAVHRNYMSRTDIASFARCVIESGKAGDVLAVSILKEAARELAMNAVCLSKRVKFKSQKILISTMGSIFRVSPQIMDEFTRIITAEIPNAKIVEPMFPPVIGALLLGFKEYGTEITPELREKISKSL